MNEHLLCIALAAACAQSAAAAPRDGAAADERIATLDTLVVTGVAPAAALTFVTDPRLPRQPVPASDGADYLKTVPGFAVLRSGGTNGDPVLRGMFGSRLNLLAGDGAMMGACPSRMDNAMSYVSPETYDRLTIVKGPQTVLWGGGASAGTVRFERETPYFDRPGVRASGSLLAGGNGRSDQVLDASAGAPRGYARFTGNRSQADDYRDGAGREVPSAWRKWNADAAFGWTPDADTVLEASLGTGDGEARYAGRGMDGAQFERTSYGLRFEKQTIGGALDEVSANLYYNDVDHVMDNYTLRDPDPSGGMPMPMASNVAHRTAGGRVALTWRGAHWDLTGGADARDSRHADRGAMGRGAYRAQPWAVDARLRQAGVFAELHARLAPDRHLIGGVRLDRAEAEDARALAGGMMPVPNPTAGQTRRETLPSAFVRYEWTLADLPLHGYAGVGHTRRMPDYWELFSPDRGPDGAANAFAGLAPERTTQIDLGLRYGGRRVDAWVALYAGRMQDYIVFDYLDGDAMGATTRARNADADIRGGEAGVAWRPAQDWKLGGTLSYAWGELAESGQAMPQVPPLEARLDAGYDDGRWSAGALLRAVASQDRASPSLGNVVGRDLGPSAGFAVFSLNAGYRFDERLQLAVGIDNLFDRGYGEHLNLAGNSAFGYPADAVRIHEPGRTGWMKLSYRY
ncbi:TonB-dependent copper receptor [Luteimonas sp. Y-2-2-4F]|nr:TonB-dependent copper receptor [Luteimonas sp. Y-2-2-4F]MCD9033542.1 TonB-dependent copper receptor [Luteimonas sp. Y-2-2-4F]